MLLMKKEFFEAIRSGRKTTTLRYWRRRIVAPGSVHNIRGLGRIRIDRVCPVRLRDLRAADAHADGFETLAALKRALKRMYPRLGCESHGGKRSDGKSVIRLRQGYGGQVRNPQSATDCRRLYQIRFTFFGDDGHRRSAAADRQVGRL